MPIEQKLAKVDEIIASALPNMEGWCTPEKGSKMARLVVDAAARAGKDGVFACELGVFGGRGIVSFGLAIKHALDGNGRVHGIDPYTASAALEGKNSKENDEWWAKVDYPKILASALGWINKLDLRGVTIITGHSDNVVDDYADGSIDVLHVDANHSTDRSRKDIALWAPKVRPQGYVIFDDIDWTTTAKAQQDLLEKGFQKIEDYGTWAVFQAPR